MPHILVIDDDQQIRQAISLILSEEDCEVTCAFDGAEGERALRVNKVDIIITDIFMPNQDGLQTIINIRRDWPALKIIAMSGSTDHHDYLRHAKLLGAHHILAKPFNAAQLVEGINACSI